MVCRHCGVENRPEAKFCGECGAALATLCPQCGSLNEPGRRFCDACGARFDVVLAPPAVAPAPTLTEPAMERRLVSVLFADLVGFTSLSEQRDAEEVRDLLSRYFDACRRLIVRYGGTVEKFIGDAVMAVWGTPRAQEDDPERAVRSALELATAVAALGEEVGAPRLCVRAGVVTGTAAVTLGAVGQGMVAGDLVNTASRVQAAADPGMVLVGERTRHATEAAIAYGEPRTHTLKGKAEPVMLWPALRVTAGRGGALKSEGLEPPFVGRDRELRLVKDLFHATADGRRAHLVSVVGSAGIGKSRLGWEFFKYVDGLAESALWHQGRCLAYGEGVAYWAFAEMVRVRAGILDGDDLTTSRHKLGETVAQYAIDGRERAWLEPRLAQLLGIEDQASSEREDLFAAWRRFLERLADREPTILLFEDVQWADVSLLEFIEYLLDWSREHPLYVVTLARPELTELALGWGTRIRNFTGLYLEPLPDAAMAELLTGLVPGLPPDLRTQILRRAEGVPLYAVETVRMLLDGGMVERTGDSYRVTHRVESLAVPESLHALIAARLDGLRPEERRLLQHAAVLGKTFSRPALAALTAMDEDALDPALDALRRKEILSLQADGRFPDRGRYAFVQDLLRHVAYETLARRERRDYHLTAAAFLERDAGIGEQEAAEVLASHYLQAYLAAPGAPDAESIKTKARDMLARAGERAASLAASEEAYRYFEQAAELADDVLLAAPMRERSGEMAWAAGHTEAARRDYEQAHEAFESDGQRHRAARVAARLAEITWAEGRIEEAVAEMEQAFAVLATDPPDEDLAELTAELGRFLYFAGVPDRALERCERALEMAESLRLPAVLSQALNTKGIALITSKGRPEEGGALLRHALVIALEHDVPSAAVRAYYNLSNVAYHRDLNVESVQYARDGLTLARRLGDRSWEWNFLAGLVSAMSMAGEWDEALAYGEQIPFRDQVTARFAGVELLLGLPQIHIARGQVEEAVAVLQSFETFRGSADVQERATFAAVSAGVLRAQGSSEEGLALAREACAARGAFGAAFTGFKFGFVEAQECAFAIGDLAAVEELQMTVSALPGGERTPFVDAQAARLGARLDALRGNHDGAERGYKRAAALFREIDAPFWLAVTLLGYGEGLVAESRSADAELSLAEAEAIFTRLAATPSVERSRAARARCATQTNTTT